MFFTRFTTHATAQFEIQLKPLRHALCQYGRGVKRDAGTH
ncbi:hypothetical protein PUN4_50060 [Paraburkholderia unamae]|nr:hypothetical protein PUN4_50060 [Paraburkholderia unamae]